MAQNVTVRYFAAAAEAAGVEEERLTLDDDATLGALRAALTKRHGAPMARAMRGGSFLVAGRVRRDDGAIREGGADPDAAEQTIDVLPPFAGG